MDEEGLLGEVQRRGWLTPGQAAEVRTGAGRGGVWAYLVAHCLSPEQVQALRGGPRAGRIPGPGERVAGRYEVLRSLGRGAMGAVFAARDQRSGREVALKVQLEGSRQGAETALARFQLEGAALTKLRHPGVVEVRDAGVSEGLAYLAMELVPGSSLAELLRTRGSLPPRRAVEIALQLARALEHVHQAGVLHRDLKPENVLMTPDGRAVLTDFGLAKIVDQNQHLSTTGQLLGTPAYMAPELASGQVRQVGPATEVYGLGATLYDMLTGRPPFADMPHYQLLVAVYSSNPEPPSAYQEGIDAQLDALCLRCLAKDPSQRYPDMASLIPDLEAYAATGGAPEPQGGRRRWPYLVASALALVTLLCALAFAFGGGEVSPTPAPSSPALARLPVLSWAGSARVYAWRDEDLAVQLEADQPQACVLGRRLADSEAPAGALELSREGGALRLQPLWEGELAPGANRVPLQVSDWAALGAGDYVLAARAEGNTLRGEPLALEVALAPSWLRELSARERPSGLPPGVRPLETPRRYRNLADGSTLVWIPAGPASLFDGPRPRSTPLEEGVFLGLHEVTWAQLLRYAKAEGLKRLAELAAAEEAGASAQPAWHQALDYARWAGGRLPSEVEWSRAAWADASSWKGAVEGWSRGAERPSRGGDAEPSPFGCFDMLGNLREMTRDPDHDLDEELKLPLALPAGDLGKVVLLGGAWDERPRRDDLKLLSRKEVGFRLCVDPAGRTHQVRAIEWEVSLARFKPGARLRTGVAKIPPPQPEDLRSLGERRWTVTRLGKPWPWEEFCVNEAGFTPSLEGFYLKARASLVLAPGAWRVTTKSDDGVRVRVQVPGQKARVVLERWDSHPPTLDQARFLVEGAGVVNLEVEFCNIVGAYEFEFNLAPE